MMLDVAEVPRAPLGAQWTLQEAHLLAQQGRYLIAGPGRRVMIPLERAPVAWERSPGYIFLPNYRIAGNPENVRVALRGSGVFEDSEQIEEALAESITLENYLIPEEEGGKREAYEGEIAALRREAEERRIRQTQRAQEMEARELEIARGYLQDYDPYDRSRSFGPLG